MEVLYSRCCGIDVHKESLACMRVQDGRRKHTEVQSFGTTTAEILRLHAWLVAAECTHVAMESTGVYWQPVFNLLEGGFGVVLANAHHIKAVPGRKTDVKDCEWLADLLAQSKQRYGSPRVHEDLIELDEQVSRKRVVRLMQEEGLVARQRKRYKHTTMSDHDQPVADNLLDRRFDAAGPNQRWVGDTTEFVIGTSGKLYLAVVLDLFSRFVVG
jgi:transposase